jgi:hypothetical protein
VTPCPLCHLSLDAWQSKLKETTGKDFAMPILHLSQLVGVAAGLEESELKFKRHVVSVTPVLRSSKSDRRPGAMMKTARAGTLLGGVAGAAVGGVGSSRLGAAANASMCLAAASEELAGLRIAHLSDFHFGLPSRVPLPRSGPWIGRRAPARSGGGHGRPVSAPAR